MMCGMLAIGEVARRAGLKPSALRFYERLGLLPVPARASGRRRYDESALLRLRGIGFAREGGFSLQEIGQLFSGRPYSARLRQLPTRQLGVLEHALEPPHTMQSLLP